MIITDRPVQVAIGVGLPTGGELVKGGIALDITGGTLKDIYTSTDGTNVVRLQVPSQTDFTNLSNAVTAMGGDGHLTSGNFDNTTNTLTLTTSDGTVTNIVIPDDKILLVNDLTTGGVTKALTAEMGKQLKTETDNKVDKVAGSSLVPDAEITKLGSLVSRVDVRATGTGTDLVTETGIRTAIDSSVPKIYEY